MFRKTGSADARAQDSSLKDDPNESFQETEISRRLLFARGVELVSTAPLLVLRVSNALNHRDYATIDGSQAKVSAIDANREMQVMAGSLAALDTALGALQELAVRPPLDRGISLLFSVNRYRGQIGVTS